MQMVFADSMPAIFSFLEKSVVYKDEQLYVAIAGLIGDIVDC